MVNASNNTFRDSPRRFAIKQSGVNASPPSSPTSSVGISRTASKRKVPLTLEDCKSHRNNFKELGEVKFQHISETYDEAKAQARTSNKPLLILFDEIPGCKKCISFGKTVLSHPLLVEAMESHFVTVVVNNRGMTPADDLLLALYKEPRMNNPVLRFVNAKTEKDVAPRVAEGFWTVGAVARSMEKALSVAPLYLRLLKQEYVARSGIARSQAHATFAVDCFWVGEQVFAKLDGVIGTDAGWCGRNEVVRVTYDSDVLTYLALVRYAIEKRVAQTIYVTSRYEREQALFELQNYEVTSQLGDAGRVYEIKASSRIRTDADSKHWLRKTDMRYVPMTTLQAMKVNLALSYRNSTAAKAMLSPRQVLILDAVQKKKKPSKEMADVPIEAAWKHLEREGIFDESS